VLCSLFDDIATSKIHYKHPNYISFWNLRVIKKFPDNVLGWLMLNILNNILEKTHASLGPRITNSWPSLNHTASYKWTSEHVQKKIYFGGYGQFSVSRQKIHSFHQVENFGTWRVTIWTFWSLLEGDGWWSPVHDLQ
jgi:hypothetical protein